MRKYLLPISLFLVYLITFLLEVSVDTEITWRMVNLVNYILLPVSILTFFFRLNQTEEHLTLILLILTLYLISDVLIHFELIYTKITSGYHIGKIKILLLCLWGIASMLAIKSLLESFFSFRKLLKEGYLSNKVFLRIIFWMLVSYTLEYEFFDVHIGFLGEFHGHSFWESSSHLH